MRRPSGDLGYGVRNPHRLGWHVDRRRAHLIACHDRLANVGYQLVCSVSSRQVDGWSSTRGTTGCCWRRVTWRDICSVHAAGDERCRSRRASQGGPSDKESGGGRFEQSLAAQWSVVQSRRVRCHGGLEVATVLIKAESKLWGLVRDGCGLYWKRASTARRHRGACAR